MTAPPLPGDPAPGEVMIARQSALPPGGELPGNVEERGEEGIAVGAGTNLPQRSLHQIGSAVEERPQGMEQRVPQRHDFARFLGEPQDCSSHPGIELRFE